MYTVENYGEGDWRVCGPDIVRVSCATEADATRIARALNRDAAMGEVREALVECAESLAVSLDRLGVCGEGDGKDRLADNDSWGGTDALNRARQALAALDAAGKGE